MLLAEREGAFSKTVRHPWAPSAAAGGTSCQLWSLSYEALEEIAQLAGVPEEKEATNGEPKKVVVPGRLTCVTCGLTFETRDEQAAHFSSDRHRENARRRSAGLAPTKDDDDAETGSPAAAAAAQEDSSEEEEAVEEEEEEEERCELVRDFKAGTAEVDVSENRVVSLSVAALGGRGYGGGRRGKVLTQAVAAARLWDWADAKRRKKNVCAVLVLRSGRFVGCVFDETGRVLVHKTLSRYTTRKGQGGAQSTMDNTGKKPKSIGSQLRRHGERALAEDVKHLVTEEWRDALFKCAAIYVAGPRSMVTGLLIDHLGDANIQRIPFALARLTLANAIDAALRLSTIFLHTKTFDQPPTVPLEEEEDTPVKVSPPPPPPKEETEEVPVIQYPEPSGSSRLLLEACERGDASAVQAMLREAPEDLDVDAPDIVGKRPLHLAAAAQAPALVKALFDAGADPAQLDERARPAYFFATDRRTRDAFREARAHLGEDVHDWLKAAVPEPIDAAQKAAKKAKDAEKKKKQRDRQKLAKHKAAEQARLAADKAKLEKKDAPPSASGGCDSCRKPIVGPRFHRLEFTYCSAACASAHRRALSAAAAEKRMAALSST